MSGRKPFDRRAFAALAAGASGLCLAVTGIGSHLHHSESLTPERHAWMAAHMALALLFVVFGTWHAVLNARPLLRHLRGAAGHLAGFSREAAWAAALIAMVLLAAAGHGSLAR